MNFSKSINFIYMKILATSDLHGNLDNLDLTGIDMVVIAGDVAPLKGRGPWHIYNQVKWVNKQLYEFCNRYPSIKFIITPGNHDFFLLAKEMLGNTILPKKDLDIRFPSNVHFLVDAEVKVNGMRIYGSPWVPIISHRWAYEAEPKILEEKFNKIPDGLDILITHSPPKHQLLGVSCFYGKDSNDFGSIELKQAIEKKKPKFAFCGHIHTGDHCENRIGDTSIYNVSRLDESYDIHYEPLTLIV